MAIDLNEGFSVTLAKNVVFELPNHTTSIMKILKIQISLSGSNTKYNVHIWKKKAKRYRAAKCRCLNEFILKSMDNKFHFLWILFVSGER